MNNLDDSDLDRLLNLAEMEPDRWRLQILRRRILGMPRPGRGAVFRRLAVRAGAGGGHAAGPDPALRPAARQFV